MTKKYRKLWKDSEIILKSHQSNALCDALALYAEFWKETSWGIGGGLLSRPEDERLKRNGGIKTN